MIGGCFGCQIIAVALGGEVDYNPDSRFILKAETILPLLSSDDNQNKDNMLSKYFTDVDVQSSYQIIVSHGDCVRSLPVLIIFNIPIDDILYLSCSL